MCAERGVKKSQYLRDVSGGRVDLIAWIVEARIVSDGEAEVTLRDSTDVRTFRVRSSSGLIRRICALPPESIIRLTGELAHDVLTVSDLNVIAEAPRDIPVSPYKADPADVDRFCRYSYLTIRSPRTALILRVQQLILYYSREFLMRRGFVELLPPVISPCSDPGLRGARKLVTKYYGRDYELMSSVIMFKQAAVASLEKVFFVARNVREEPVENVKTGRHLCEFTQIDVEWAFADMYDVMRLGEELVVYVIDRVLRSAKDVIEKFNPDLKAPKTPFKVITYDDAVDMLRRHGVETPRGQELTQDGETKLSELIGDEPIWITHLPRTSRGFYYIEDPARPQYNRDFNLILPKGFGELIDGGEREYRYDGIVRRLKEMGEDLSKYKWFLELARVGIPPSSGWGLGVERFTRYAMNLKYIWEAAPFPKPPGVVETP